MPSQIYVKGKLPNKRVPAVAIIGSRKPTSYGEAVTHQLAYELAKQGIVIVSGLAYGIDAIAHKAALEAGGVTIAVVAQGLHRVYPAAHAGLAEQIILAGGAIISEQAMGVEARKSHFLARNRIVSGIADAVIITEATERSGTVSTVAHALSQNKEVFAVPGPITSLLSAGPNRFLQQGAHLVTRTHDIIEVIAPQLLTKQKGRQAQLPLPSTPVEASILEQIQQGISDIDMLIDTLSTAPHEILQAITMMELNGVIKVVAGKIILTK